VILTSKLAPACYAACGDRPLSSTRLDYEPESSRDLRQRTLARRVATLARDSSSGARSIREEPPMDRGEAAITNILVNLASR